MGLRLTGKGSILDAIGGAVNTAVNAPITGIKDVGDLVAEGTGVLTGNQVAQNNAAAAIRNNNQNISGNIWNNVYGLGSDVVKGLVNPVVQPAVGAAEDYSNIFANVGNRLAGRPNQSIEQNMGGDPLNNSILRYSGATGKNRQLAGNLLQTGVNVATFGKGRLLEQGVERAAKAFLPKNVIGKAAARVAGGTTVAGAYGAGQGAGQAVSTAQSPAEAARDIYVSAGKNAVLGGGIAGVTTIPSIARGVRAYDAAQNQIGAIGSDVNDKPVTPPNEPAPETAKPPSTTKPAPQLPALDERAFADKNPYTPAEPKTTTEPQYQEPSPEELHQATQNMHSDMNSSDIDYGKVNGAGQELTQKISQFGQELRSRDMTQNNLITARTDLFKRIKASGGIGSSDYEDLPAHLKNKNGPSMDKVAQDLGFADDGALHDAIEKETVAKDGTKPPLKSAEEYRGAAEQYIRSHPEEFDNVTRRADAEQHLNDFNKANRDTGYDKAKWQSLKGPAARKFIKALWDKTHSPEYHARNAVGARLGDVRDTLKGVKLLRDRAQKELDQLTKRGSTATEASIREKADELRSQKTRYNVLKQMENEHALAYRNLATALDIKHPDVNLTAKKGVRVTGGQQIETARPTPPAGQPVKARAGKQPEDPMAEIRAKNAGQPGYTGPNLNEGAFSTEERAAMDAQTALDEARNAEPRNLEGDKAIVEGIGKDASDHDILQSYMDATGSDLETAKKAYSILKETPGVGEVGSPENNPLHKNVASPEITTPAARSRTVQLLSKSGSYVRNNLIRGAMRRAVGGREWVNYLEERAKQDFNNLGPEDQALADKSRLPGMPREDLIAQAKDPETFGRFIKRTDYIQNYLHETNRLYNPAYPKDYRRNYGATLYTKDPNAPERTPSTPQKFPSGPENDSRHYHSYEDKEAATGQTRTTNNFMEDVSKDINRFRHDTTQRNLAHGLAQGFGEDKVSFGGTYNPQHVALKDFPDVRADSEIAKEINNRRMHEYGSGVGGAIAKGYDVVNKAAKDIKLSTGFFHHANIELSATALNPRIAADTAHATVSPQFFLDSMDKWEANGTLEKYVTHGGTLGAGSEFESFINKGKYNPMRILHSSLFQREIPYAKVANFEHFTKGLDPTTPEGAAALGRVAGAVNDMFGGINRALSGLTPRVFKVFARGVLALDYNEGQIRTVMAAISKGGVEGRMARQMVVGRAGILAMPGTIQAAANGSIGNNPEDIGKFVLKQLADPTYQTPGWKTGGGNPKEISGLATVTNKIYRGAAPALNPNNPDKLSGVKSELSGNLAALPAAAQEEINNRDFYGNPMHGKGLSAAQDVGQLAGAVAPIPAQPAARALEGTRFGKNQFVQAVAGGQSAISPGEAAIDISGIGRVKANPDAPAMQIMNNRQLVAEGLKGDTQATAGLYAVHPSWDPSLTKAEQAAKYNDKDYYINKWNAMDNPTVLAALAKQDAFAKAHGEPGNPLFDLSPQDQQMVIRYQALKAGDPGSGNDSAAYIYAHNKDLITQFEQDSQGYQQQMSALFQKSGGIQGSQEQSITPGGVPYPQIDPTTQDSLTQYYNLTDGKAQVQYLADNPDVKSALNDLFNYQNARRAALDEPLLKPFPEASPELNTFMDSYSKASKADRAGLRNSNAGLFGQMQTYMGQVDEYELARSAGQAKFQGQDLSQANLKQIYNLGQYDINPSVASDGTTSYSVNPQAAAKTRSAKGSSEVQKLLNDIERSHATKAVRFAGKTAYIRKQSKRKIYIASPRRPNAAPFSPKRVAIKAKSVSVA